MKVEFHDNVNHPQHYSGEIECIDYIMQITKGMDGDIAFNLGNVIKYIHRYPTTDKVEDLRKARWYLDYAIRMIGDNDNV